MKTLKRVPGSLVDTNVSYPRFNIDSNGGNIQPKHEERIVSAISCGGQLWQEAAHRRKQFPLNP
jgi:hypothetical protein